MQMLKNFCRQNKCYQKCALFPAPSSQWFISHQLHHHESYMSWSTRFLCLNLSVGFCIFNSVSFFFKLLFWFNKKQAVFQISVKIKIIEKPHTQPFAPRPLVFKLQQEVSNFNDICSSWSSSKTPPETNLENRRFENVSFSQ